MKPHALMTNALAGKPPRLAPIREARPARVLLVDDGRGDVLLTRRWLGDPKGNAKGIDCELMTAATVGEALERLHAVAAAGGETDLVLLDINLGGDSGFSLLEKIRADPVFRRIPVVMCTGSAHEVDRRYARLLGVVGYMLKPLGPEALRTVIEHLPRLSVVEGANGLKLMAA